MWCREVKFDESSAMGFRCMFDRSNGSNYVSLLVQQRATFWNSFSFIYAGFSSELSGGGNNLANLWLKRCIQETTKAISRFELLCQSETAESVLLNVRVYCHPARTFSLSDVAEKSLQLN